MKTGLPVALLLFAACSVPQAVQPATRRAPTPDQTETAEAERAHPRPHGETLARTTPVAPLRYRIISKHFAAAGKASFDVRIPAAAEVSDIREMAMEIRKSQALDRNPVFVMFLLPDMEPGAGAYAAVEFRPEMHARILGITPSKEAELNPAPSNDELIGRWVNQAPFGGGVIEITQDLLLEQRFKDGSVVKKQLTEKKTPRGRRFDQVPASRHGDHFLLRSSGDLEIRDNEGLIRTALKLR